MSHSHSHSHAPSPCEATRTKTQTQTKTAEEKSREAVLLRLKLASTLCLVFLIVEVIGGVWSGSLTVLSDAAHLLADLASFLVAIGAWYLANMPATERHTFGFRRVEALAALFSVSSLALVSVMLAVEALRRLWLHAFPSWGGGDEKSPVDVDGRLMSGVAAIGVMVNVALAFVLGAEGHAHSHGHGGECGHSHGHHGHGHEVEVGGGDGEKNPTNGGSKVGGHDHSHDHDREAGEVATPNTRLLSAEQGQTSNISIESYGTAQSTTPEVDGVLHNDELPAHDHHSHGGSAHEGSGAGAEKPSENLNLYAAYLHVLGDLSMSVAVLIAGLFIWWKPHWQIMDPICTILFCIVVLYSTVSVFRSSLSVLLEEVPPHLSWEEVHDKISAVDGVGDVHCLHIWSISHGVAALSVHVTTSGEVNDALRDVGDVCRRFKIGHATVQVEQAKANGEVSCITCEMDPTSGFGVSGGNNGEGITRSGRDSCMQQTKNSLV